MSSGSSPNYNFAHISPNSENPEVAVNGTIDAIDAALFLIDDRLATVETAGGGSAGLPPGGLAGQILAKASDAEGDFVWIDPPTGGTPTNPAKYRRYRLLMKAGSVNGGYAYGMSGVTFLDSAGLAISTAGAEFGEAGHTGANVVSRLFDNNDQTWWEHSPGGGIDQNVDSWITVTFPANVDIRAIKLTSRNDPDAVSAAAVTGKQVPRSVDYQYATDADPTTWVTAQNIGGGNGVANYNTGEARTFPVASLAGGAAATFDKYRITVNESRNGGGGGVATLKLLTAADAVIPIASIEHNRALGGYPSSNMIDGSDSTFFTVGGDAAAGIVWTLTLSAAAAVKKISLLPRQDGYPNEVPTNITLQGVKPDGSYVALGTIAADNGPGATGDATTRLFTIP